MIDGTIGTVRGRRILFIPYQDEMTGIALVDDLSLILGLLFHDGDTPDKQGRQSRQLCISHASRLWNITY
jgi:hypothetical protein